MKKNAFTLVELLAIITVLAVILVIAVPKIINTIKDAKMGSLKSSVILLAKDAEEEYGIRDAKGTLDQVKNPIKCEDVANIDDTYDKCQIKFDKEGNATVLLNANEKSKFGKIGCVGTKSKVECDNGAMTLSKRCTTPDKLVSNLKFVDGQYTYTYNGSNGWSVVLTDKESTDPVTTELCETVNDKPIVSMYEMFRDSKAESIDTSSFDTSNVTDMRAMFDGSAATEIKGLEKFDTSNVTSMWLMFFGSKATVIDVSSFDTSKATSMQSMFSSSAATETKGLQNFNTSNVTSMGGMFWNSAATSLDVSSFDTSNVTDMGQMFWGSAATEIKGLNKFNTSKVTNMNNMFSSTKVASLGLSRFNTSKVTNMGSMFASSKATVIDVSSFDTSKVTNMSGMFSSNAAIEIKGLENFDTSKVTEMSQMFFGSKATSLDLSSFDTSNVTSMWQMFFGSEATSLDLSSFDTSKVTNMNEMFFRSYATTGYARTQKDADRFNASSNKPSGLTFVVKS